MGFPGPEMTIEVSFRTGRDITAVMDVAEVNDSGGYRRFHLDWKVDY